MPLAAENVVQSPDDNSAESLGILSIAYGPETEDGGAEKALPIMPADVHDAERGRPLVAYGSAADDDMREALGLPEPSGDVDDEQTVDDLDVVFDDLAPSQPPARTVPVFSRRIAPRAATYKPGTRVIPAKAETAAPGPPWWASTDPKVRAEGQAAAIARGKRIKTGGENHIIGMGGSV